MDTKAMKKTWKSTRASGESLKSWTRRIADTGSPFAAETHAARAWLKRKR